VVKSFTDVFTPAFAVTRAEFTTNGIVQLVPIEPAVADNVTVDAVATVPDAVNKNVALFAAML
jgi:hypothetical protein